MNNSVYYRVIRSYKDNRPVVACMQWFDEPDYDQSRFLTDEQFETEADAEAWIQNMGSICPLCGCVRTCL